MLNWALLSVEEIADEFDIPLLAEIIEYNQTVDVNMNHISGWVEEDGENFLFMPNVEFHPIGDREGFTIRICDVELREDGEENASVYHFHISDDGDGYTISLDDDDNLLEQRVVIPESEREREYETYPPIGTQGYNNPFKRLGFDPTAE